MGSQQWDIDRISTKIFVNNTFMYLRISQPENNKTVTV